MQSATLDRRMQSATGTLTPVTADELDDARESGRKAAADAIAAHAPTDPIRRLAWAVGYGHVSAIDDAVMRAREAGLSWRQIGEAMDENPRTVQSRYVSPDRWQKYKDRHATEAGD